MKTEIGQNPLKQLCPDNRYINIVLPKSTPWKAKALGEVSPYILPWVQQIFSVLTGNTILSLLDQRSSYYNMALDEESKSNFAFVLYWEKYELTCIHLVFVKHQIVSLIFSLFSTLLCVLHYLGHPKHIKTSNCQGNQAMLGLTEFFPFFSDISHPRTKLIRT